MSIGGLEIVVTLIVGAGALGGHLVGLLVLSKSNRWRRRIAVIWGWPLCFAVAAVMTPPDVISLLILAIGAGAVYGVIVGVWLLVCMSRDNRTAGGAR